MCIVASIRVLLELRGLAQFRDAVNGETCALQLQRRRGLACGRYQFVQRKTGFQHFVLAFLLGVDVVGRFIRIGQGFVMIDLITKITLGVGQVIPIPCLATVQLAALGYGGILVFVDVVGVFVVFPR